MYQSCMNTSLKSSTAEPNPGAFSLTWPLSQGDVQMSAEQTKPNTSDGSFKRKKEKKIPWLQVVIILLPFDDSRLNFVLSD